MTPATRARRYWLVKSEPDSFSFDDLLASPGRTTCWDGVRNYQARNSMRDDMKLGDLVFFYHSSTEPAAIVGIAEVVRESYPDHTAFDRKDSHYDPKSKPDAPTWMMVDLRAREPLAAIEGERADLLRSELRSRLRSGWNVAHGAKRARRPAASTR